MSATSVPGLTAQSQIESMLENVTQQPPSPAEAEQGRPTMQQTVEAMRKRSRFAKLSEAQTIQAADSLTKRLQQCDLTINFNAGGFFKAKNSSTSYQGMYERTGLIFTNAILGGVPTSKAAYNRNTKQIYAALNYGQNPHGPAIRYGMSYFVLNPKFKAMARFFAGSTFLHESEHECASEDHVDWEQLGAIYGVADKNGPELREALERACFDRQTLSDDVLSCEKQLIEAHFSEHLWFAGGIETIFLSRMAVPAMDKSRQGAPLYGKQWDEVHDNAKDFAWRIGAELTTLRD